MVQWITEFNDNVIHPMRESRVLNLLKPKLRVFSHPMPLAERNQIRAIERGNHGLHRFLHSRLKPAQDAGSAAGQSN